MPVNFVRKADALIPEIHNRRMIPVISGGTAYYLKSWLLGLPDIPPADKSIRYRVKTRWEGQDNQALRQALKDIDPESAARIGAGDRYRLLRALEVYEQCGKPLSSFKPPESSKKRYGHTNHWTSKTKSRPGSADRATCRYHVGIGITGGGKELASSWCNSIRPRYEKGLDTGSGLVPGRILTPLLKTSAP